MNVFKLLKYLLVDAFTFYGGGGKGGGSAPSAPDPNVVAAATTKTNTDTAAFNKALNLNNYSNPFGSQQTTQTGVDPKTGAPIYNTQISANPQLQDALGGLLNQASQSGQYNADARNGLYQLNSNYDNLGSQFSNVAGQYGNLNQGIGALGSQYSNISNKLGGLQGQYSGLNSQLSGLGSQLDQGAAKAAQQQGQDAAYKAQTQYLDPQFSQQNESLGAQLANQGLTPGSEAYNNAMTNFNNTKQNAYSNAQNQAIMTGSQLGAQNLQNQIAGINTQSGLLNQQAGNLGAQSGLYGQQAGLVGNQAGLFGLQGQNLAGQLSAYGQQGNTYGSQSGLMGQLASNANLPYSQLGSIASLIPGYSGTGQASSNPADIAGLYNNQYQSQLANYNAQQQSSNNSTSGLFGLGAASLLAPAGTFSGITGAIGSMFSDRRLKRDVKRVGTWPNGLAVYSYRYVWEKTGRHIGFMADEVKKKVPQAVILDPSGFDRVNYVMAGGAQ